MAKPQSERRLDGAVGVGVDVVDVARLARVVALRGTALVDRVFTVDELAECRGSVRRLAARLAAKEAAAPSATSRRRWHRPRDGPA